jgi:hypothetical protein
MDDDTCIKLQTLFHEYPEKVKCILDDENQLISLNTTKVKLQNPFPWHDICQFLLLRELIVDNCELTGDNNMMNNKRCICIIRSY